MDNLILIDTSYTSFYRFFATLRWLSHSDPTLYHKYISDPIYDWGSNTKFMNTYTKMYMESIKKLVGAKIYKTSKLIFCMDSRLSSLWRTKIMKTYKASRPDLAQKYNFTPIFKTSKYELIPALIKNDPKKIYKIYIDGAEADDIIAVICKYYKSTDINKKIYIVSGDSDFYQLGRSNVYFVNYKKKGVLEINESEAIMLLRYKVLKGDVTDNIPSIFKNIIVKNKKNIIFNEELLKAFLAENKICKSQYELNRKLIDFNYIPKKIIDIILLDFMALNI